MPLDAPFQLGPFSVDEEGRLSLASPDAAPRFGIEWRGCRVEASLAVGEAQALGELKLRATVGRVPSTAADAAGQRTAVFSALRSLPKTLPAGWQADLTADHQVAVLSASKVEMPTTVEQLLCDMTMFLMALGPYLDLLAGLGVETPAAGRPGTAKTCPG